MGELELPWLIHRPGLLMIILGKPLIDDVYNEAQPIDQFVYKDSDGTYYMFYGGWGKCNLVKLNDRFYMVLFRGKMELFLKM